VFQSLITELAPGKEYSDKFVYCLLGANERIAAIIDMIRNYPENGIWFVGLLFVGRSHRRQGLGSRLAETICTHIAEEGGHAARVAVALDNQSAMAFWTRAGFEKLYDTERERGHLPPLRLSVMERQC
jgi:ribosomal protein S18 acetylase RimI-like enzyme